MYDNASEPRHGRGDRKEGVEAGHNGLDERNALVEEYLTFVEGLVSRLMRAMGLPQRHREDFVAAGLLGLVEAAGRFDAGRGSEFRSFAYLRVRGAVIDHIRASCELSGHAYQVLKALESAQELRTQSLEDRRSRRSSPSGHAAEGIEVLSKSAVAYAIVGAAHGQPLYVNESPSDPEREISEKQTSEKIRAAIATLPEKERTIVEQYYFNDLTLSEVAKGYSGLSKSWVSRLHDRALSMLRERLAERGIEG
jgi:RNA polymerase sigma factor for flagellar operon FliA